MLWIMDPEKARSNAARTDEHGLGFAKRWEGNRRMRIGWQRFLGMLSIYLSLVIMNE